MKSGMVTMTASMLELSLSSILRKSLYFGGLGNSLWILADFLSSTSHNATMFSVGAQPRISLSAFPPAPIEAIFSFSLGDLYPAAFNEVVLPKPPLGIAPASSEP